MTPAARAGGAEGSRIPAYSRRLITISSLQVNGASMISVNSDRRKFLAAFSILAAPVVWSARNLHAQSPETGPPSDPGSKSGDDKLPPPVGSPKAALQDNEKNLKKKVEKLFQLATELKEEADKTDSINVLSIAMLKKADEIEKLAKDIKTRAKG